MMKPGEQQEEQQDAEQEKKTDDHAYHDQRQKENRNPVVHGEGEQESARASENTAPDDPAPDELEALRSRVQRMETLMV